MNVAQIITAKRDGCELDEADIHFLIDGYAKGRVQDGQMAAFAMAVFFKGMSHREVAVLTRAMLNSGEILQWSGSTPMVDKHSTGGIGDKISIPLAPILAECGMSVPMISGRGLGTTGGTIDKLESIAGYRTDLSLAEIKQVVETVGCTITAASAEIAPADKRLYALRDVTGTVPSVPLITASILSKKLAEGLDALVLDVKWGNGAFMKTLPAAETLATSLVRTAQELDLETRAILTDMNRPLGKMIGNGLEIDESVDVLRGQGPDDVVLLTLRLAAELLVMCHLANSIEAGMKQAEKTIANGRALLRLEQMVAAHGGDLTAERERAAVYEVAALHAGFISQIDCDRLGLAVIQMGGGRKAVGETIDPSVGIEMLTDVGCRIEVGQSLAKVYCHRQNIQEANRLVSGAFTITADPSAETIDLIGKTLTIDNIGKEEPACG